MGRSTTTAAILGLALGACAAGAAFGQDASEIAGLERRPKPSMRVVDVCAPEAADQLCLQPRIEDAQPPQAAPRAKKAREQSGKLTRFTRLAGMFMGRVDVADLGRWKLRFNLEIR